MGRLKLIILLYVFIMVSVYAQQFNDYAQQPNGYVQSDCLTINFNEGWNMISIPSIIVNGLPKLKGEHYIYSYDTLNNNYVLSNEIKPGIGYVILVIEKQSYDVCPSGGQSNNAKFDNVELKLSNGWNLISVPYNGIYVNEYGTELVLDYYESDVSVGSYVLADMLIPGHSYFVYSDVYVSPRDGLSDYYCGDRICDDIYETEFNCLKDCAKGYGWPQYKSNSERTTRTLNYGPFNNEIDWVVNLSARYASSSVINLKETQVVLNEYYGPGYTNNISVYSTIDGTKLWSTYISDYYFDYDFFTTTPVVYSKYIYVSADNGFHVLKADTGRIEYSELRDSFSKPDLLLIPENEYVDGGGTIYYAIDNEIVARKVPDYTTERWRVNIENELLSVPVPLTITHLAGDDDYVYVMAKHDELSISNKRWIYALDKDTGELVWKNNFPFHLDEYYDTFDMLVDAESVIVTDSANTISYNKIDGSYRWDHVLLGVSPYYLLPSGIGYDLSGRISLLDNKRYIGKSTTDGVVGMISEENEGGLLFADGYGIVKPVLDVPTYLEEYSKLNVIVSPTSNQAIIVFMSTTDIHLPDGSWSGDEDFNAIYSYDLNGLLRGGIITDYNWRTSPFRTINGLVGNPSMSSKHVFITTRWHHSGTSPMQLIALGVKGERVIVEPEPIPDGSSDRS